MVSTRLKYFVRILLGILLGIYLGLIVLLNIPYVQGRLSAFVSKELRGLLHTEVTLGKIDMGLLNRIIVEDVLLHDRDGEELLKVARLSAKFELLPLLKGRIAISSVQLFGFNIRMAKDTPEAVPNFQFVLDAFASKDTTDTETNLDLRINSVLIRRGRISYNVLSEPETPGKFNANHLAVKNLSATLSLKALTPDSLNAAIRRFSFDEQSGFALKKLTVKVVANRNRLDIKDFDIELPETALRMDSLTLTYDSISGLARMEEGTTSSGALRGSVVLKDFAPFVPALGRMEEPLYMLADFSTHGKNLDCPSLRIANRNQSLLIAGEAALSNWDAGPNMYLYGKLANLTLMRTSIEGIMSGLTGKVPAIVQRIGNVHCRGEAAGYLHDLTLTGTLNTDAGTLRTDVMMSTNPDRGSRTYSGSVASADLNVGRLLGKEDKFGKADFNVELKGFNYEGHYPESYIKGIVASLEYSGYRYENILLDGVYKDGGFNGKLALDDENGSVQIDGSFNTEQAVPDFNLKAVVKNLRPHDLHLTDRYEHADLSLSLTADFTGNSIDDMNGRISLDSLQLNAPDDGGYFLNNLTVTAGQVDGKKEVRITSPFLTGVVRGDYSYHTIPASVVQTVQRYIPSLLSINDLPRPHNNFLFDIRIENAEMFSKLFGVPLELNLPATLKGYFNDTEEQLRVEGHFPGFSYNGTHYDSGVLLCENPSDRFRCSLRGAMLLKSGAMLNLSVEGDAKDDMLSTTINWGNNTDVTYGGKFAARTHFFKTEGNRPLLQANIEIQPTEVVLNDTVWHIHPSHIAVDSGRVFVDNFLFEHENQHLKIDGRFTAKETDSCLVDLKNIRLDYVLDIVRFDDVAFGGLITGRVNLKSVMKDPVMQTRLRVHDFRLNHALLGDADITGTWDKELGGVRLDAQIEEAGGVSATHATGYVSPKLKGLDLYMQARKTNIGFLQPFIEGIFSELDGRMDGHVRLYGDFKHLDLEGEVKGSMEAKIDALNTYFQIREDSIHIASGSIDFRNVKIYDREGHEGTVNGYLHHTKLKNLMYHFNIQGNNLLMYDTREAGDMSFYGRVYGTGNVVLNGGNNAMTVDASLTTGRNTTFTYITGVTTEAASNQFITFVDKTPKRIQDNVETHLYHHSNAQEEEEEEGPPMDLRINMLIDATPDASMRIIMDPVAGDNITATGRGTLQVNYFNKGDFRMFGSYVIDEGLYKLSMQEVIRKDFALNSGGTVTFTGDPYEANLDLQAVYTVNSASLSDLVVDQSRSQGTVKVNCLMNLSGNLSNPDIKFDLELPTVREEDRELVRSVTSTEEQMNTQIIYLLGIGKFYTYDYANDQSSNATSSLAFSTLSGQLNNMLSQWMDNKNWNIGANLSTGEKGWTDVEAEAILSGRLLNNRLIINGNFGYKENVMANTNFVGDFEAIWLLTPNGDFRLRGYNQTNDRYFIKSTLTTQGIGIMYKKDFNTWDDLFRWFAWKRRNKRNQNTY